VTAPVPRVRSQLALVAVTGLLVLGLVGVVAVVRAGRTALATPPARTSASPSPSPPPTFRLSVSLGPVKGRGAGAVAHAKDLRAAAEAIRTSMRDLYETAFVDPSAWKNGRFSGLDRFFAPTARAAVHRDRDELSLGDASRRLVAVRPRRARLALRFVTDRGRHPVVAFAEMDFAATGIGADASTVPIAQRGRYVLQRSHAGWRIVSFDARTKIPRPHANRAKPRSARFAAGPASSRPLFVLVIGSDARPGQSLTSTRSDALHIVSVNPRRHRGAIVGIPRDSYVPIPGHGTSKINAALSDGGPGLVVRTVEALSHVHIDAYLLTGFEGFHHLIDAIGGLDVRVPYRMDDPNSGAHFRPGPTHLSGREALAFSRDRHDVPGGDFGRSMDQGRVLLATLRTLRSELARDPARLVPWLLAAARYVRTDLSLSQMATLLLAASTFRPDRVRNTVVSGSGATANGQSIVRLGSGAERVFRDVARDGILGH